ncbi:MFS transporter [Kocuria sp.]|uniref:MFS transporter n=1 Tax=Kocuria sp. TaxID=1871328 RepID=UPI0026DC2495|nr:MFS transporter [Kocuria sp.]MDO4919069.1 MFS transporter [Kocuria sp.]
MTSRAHHSGEHHENWHERSPATGTGELPVVSPRQDPETHRGYAHGTDPRRWQILAVLLVAIFMSLVAVSSINVGLPSIQEGIGASESQLQWILSGYALTFGVVLVAGGRAGDIFGRGFLWMLGVLVFTLSSIAAGLAPDPTMLIAARFVQGVGSGLLNPQGVAMIQQYFKGAERGKAFGMLGSAVGVSVAIGPVLGGLLIQSGGTEHGWRWLFAVNVPVGVVALVLAFLWFPRPLVLRPQDTGLLHALKGMDPVGAVLLGLALLATLLPFIEAGSPGASPWTWALLAVAAVLLVLWIAWEKRTKASGHQPMVDLDIFKVSSFFNGTLLISLYFLGITSVWVLITLYMQQGLGHTALAAGCVGLLNAVASAVASNIAGSLVNRMGRRIVVLGMASVILGLGLSAGIILLHDTWGVSEWWLVLTMGFVGLGQGAVVSPNQTLTLAEVPLEYAGSAGGVMQTGQRVGTAVGIAMITAAAYAAVASQGWAVGIAAGLGMVVLVVALALLVALRDMRHRARQAPAA